MRPARARGIARRGRAPSVLLPGLPGGPRPDPRARPRRASRGALAVGARPRRRSALCRARRSRLSGADLPARAGRAPGHRALPRGRALQRLRLAGGEAAGPASRRGGGAARPAALAGARAVGSRRGAPVGGGAPARRPRLRAASAPRDAGRGGAPPRGSRRARARRPGRRGGGQCHGHRLRPLRRHAQRDGARVRRVLPLGEPAPRAAVRGLGRGSLLPRGLDGAAPARAQHGPADQRRAPRRLPARRRQYGAGDGRGVLRLGDGADLPAALRPLPPAPPAARRRRRRRAGRLALPELRPAARGRARARGSARGARARGARRGPRGRSRARGRRGRRRPVDRGRLAAVGRAGAGGGRGRAIACTPAP